MSEQPVSAECDAARLELNAYIDGVLAPAEHAAIARHIGSCAACRAELDLLRLVTQSLRLVPRPEPSAAMRQRLLAHVAAELPPRKVDIHCTERHGDRVVQRREVQLYREPALRPQSGPAPPPPTHLRRAPRPITQHYWRESCAGRHCYQVIESHYGREE